MIATLISRYGISAVYIVLSAGITYGAYAYWEASVYDEGYQAATREYNIRDAVTEVETRTRIDHMRALNRKIQEDQDGRYKDALRTAHKNIEDINSQLAAANHRLRVRTKPAEVNRNGVCSATSVPAGLSAESQALYELRELDSEVTGNLREYAAGIEVGKKICGQMVEFLEVNKLVN